jgi:hypothetical protein
MQLINCRSVAMKDSNSQMLVILLALSLIIGCFIPGFLDNSNLVLAVTISALAFIFVDLANFLKLHKLNSIFFLFIGIFSITVLPHIEAMTRFFAPLNNFFTVYGLAIVIGILGLKQYFEENTFLSETKRNLKQRDNEFNELIKFLEDKDREIEILKKELSKKEEKK